MKKITMILFSVVLFLSTAQAQWFLALDSKWKDSVGILVPKGFMQIPSSAIIGGAGGGTAIHDSILANATGTNGVAKTIATWEGADSLGNRPFYFNASWTIDSSALVAYGTTFNRVWFRTGEDSIAIDSIGGVINNKQAADSVNLRVVWGQNRAAITDGQADTLHINTLGGTYGSVKASTKVIPPNSFVWVLIHSKSGAPSAVEIWIDGRKRW